LNDISGWGPTQSGRCERLVRCQNALEYDGHVAMKTAAPILFFTLLLTNQSALAATTTDSSALALASLVGVQSPVLNRHDKGVLTQLLGGHADVAFPANKQIPVKADDTVCNAGNVDITAHSCKLTFGGKTADLTGDKAHELYATMAQAGVPSEGSTGAVYESLSHLVRTINPHEIAQKGSGRLYVRCASIACREIKPIALQSVCVLEDGQIGSSGASRKSRIIVI
jgi:hypothetical protein